MSTHSPRDSTSDRNIDTPPRVWRYGGPRHDSKLRHSSVLGHDSVIDEHWLYETFEKSGIALRIPLAIRRERYEFRAELPHGLHLHHDFYALYVVAGGSGTHVINEQPFTVTRGDVYILAPGSVHDYRNYEFIEIDALYFLPEVLSPSQQAALGAERGLGALFCETAEGDLKPHDLMQRMHLSSARHGEVVQAIFKMRGLLDAASPLGLEMVKAALFQLLAELAQNDARSTPATRPNAKTGLESVLAFCEERFYEPLSIAQMAALMHLTPGHFSEVFAREMGMPPTVYLRQVRLERAQNLLAGMRYSIAEIAHLAGFGAPAHFSRAFRASFGVTPSQYRKDRDLSLVHEPARKVRSSKVRSSKVRVSSSAPSAN